MNPTTDRLAVRTYVRLRDDYQGMRKRVDNRLGRKADGTPQNIPDRALPELVLVARKEDNETLTDVADNARKYEAILEKALLGALRRFPVYTSYLAHIKGVGPIAAGWIIGEFDIEKATTVSKMWQFAGLNPGWVIGQKRIEDEDAKKNPSSIIGARRMGGPENTWWLKRTDTLVRGDRLTPKFVSPFNQRLRTALVGVLADGFIKQQAPYALTYYYPYKTRLEQERTTIARPAPAADGLKAYNYEADKDDEKKRQRSDDGKIWLEVSKGHRDRAAKRYMIKMFLKDLYVAWRTIEGLPVRPPYQDEYLGAHHAPAYEPQIEDELDEEYEEDEAGR